MDVNLNLDEIIGEEEKRVLRSVLECGTDQELQEALTKIGKAALYEYLDMILGRQLPTRADEMRERRLFHLLKHYFIGRIPTEAEVSSLFQLTDSDSRRLVRNVRTKFRFELEEEIINITRAILRRGRAHNGDYRVVITSNNILEELKQKVSVIAPELNQIHKVANSTCVYNIPEDTFLRLCGVYGIAIEEVEAAAGE